MKLTYLHNDEYIIIDTNNIVSISNISIKHSEYDYEPTQYFTITYNTGYQQTIYFKLTNYGYICTKRSRGRHYNYDDLSQMELDIQHDNDVELRNKNNVIIERIARSIEEFRQTIVSYLITDKVEPIIKEINLKKDE